MYKSRKQRILSGALMLSLPLVLSQSIYAAKPIDLAHQPVSILHSMFVGGASMQEIKRSVDFNQTLHMRMQETYLGYPVLGADVVLHVPHGDKTTKSITALIAKNSASTMNGIIYQDLNADLANTPATVFTREQAQKALANAIEVYQHKIDGKSAIQDKQTRLVVYIDDNNKAHWAYEVSFFVDSSQDGAMPAKPVYIMDAQSFHVYKEWNNIQNQSGPSQPADVLGGGFGGNEKMGEVTYDGINDDLPVLNIKRDSKKSCYLQNGDVIVKSAKNSKVIKFACDETNPDHNNVYWDGDEDAVNGGFSPGNDALFGGAVIKDMYQKWYGVPVLTENGEPMTLVMVVHKNMDNAYWDGSKMTFGDGISMFYPLTSLGVAAHEISHGFTEQHSGLAYYGQSGGMNEAYSDMAAQAAEFYAYGHNSWQIGPEIMKQENKALRYMDQPSKDCNGRKPGNRCSIDDASQYRDGIDVHYSSGVYNHLFYLMGTSEGWDTKKAFDVMLKANMDYWTSSSSFTTGACGILKATADYGYDIEAVKKALAGVKIETTEC